MFFKENQTSHELKTLLLLLARKLLNSNASWFKLFALQWFEGLKTQGLHTNNKSDKEYRELNIKFEDIELRTWLGNTNSC